MKIGPGQEVQQMATRRSEKEWSSVLDGLVADMQRQLREEASFAQVSEDEPLIMRGTDFLKKRSQTETETSAASEPAATPSSSASQMPQDSTRDEAPHDPARRRRSQLIEASKRADLTDSGTFERFFPEAARFVNADKEATDEAIPSRDNLASVTGAARDHRTARTLFDSVSSTYDPDEPFYGADDAGFSSEADETDQNLASPDWFSAETMASGSANNGYSSYGSSYRNGYYSNYGGYKPQERHPAPLTETLKELRALEKKAGRNQDSPEVFEKQIMLAKDYTEERAFPDHAWRQIYRPTYSSLNNTELRDYFRWRTLWRGGMREVAPGSCALLYAYELIVGATDMTPEEILSELDELLRLFSEKDIWNMTRDALRSLRHDYAIFSGIDPKSYFPDDALAFFRHVAVLRRAQNAVFAESGRDIPDPDYGTEPVSDAELLEAFAGISTFDPTRSPFFRKNQERAAAVTRRLFDAYVLHCAKRRKQDLIDGTVGIPYRSIVIPFYHAPIRQDLGTEGRRFEVAPGTSLSYERGTWIVHEPCSYPDRSRELARIFRELDREMRLAWDFGHELKPQSIPKYLQRMIDEAIAAQKDAEEAAAKAKEEAERRRFKVDLSKLSSIRSAAHETQEALLVDEEREGFEAAPAVAPAPQVVPAPAAPAPAEEVAPAPSVPMPDAAPPEQKQAAGDAHPFGLTDTEYDLAVSLLDHRDYTAIVSASPATLDMLIDSMNEKLFDLEGDVCFEFSDDGPEPIEDYREDLRKALVHE